ncbi:hypothetical protein JS565_13460 [Salmonella enterica subsp. enterica serovar Senftenberg]|nr:hypothetical protein [Salmonella enterica subsp. enterica serovar Senftenberg]
MPAGMAIARRSANPIMLTLNQVAYRWPDAAADCLHAISLELHDGEWLALTGDNGAENQRCYGLWPACFPHFRLGYA